MGLQIAAGVRRKTTTRYAGEPEEVILLLKNKPPDERAETGSPTVYKFTQREVLLVYAWRIAQSGYNRTRAILIAAEELCERRLFHHTLRCRL